MNKNTVNIPNGTLHYESIRGEETIIFIHAGFFDSREWEHQTNYFNKKYNVIIYDQRGFGNSSIVSSAFSPAEDLKFLIDQLNINKAHIVGHSLGGTIALDFSIKYP